MTTTPATTPVQVPAVGLGLTFDPALPRRVEYDAVGALPVAGSWVGVICTRAGTSVWHLPEKVPALWDAVAGGRRDPQSPVSVVGASRVGGELFATGDYPSMLGILAALNIFVGLFNLLPLLPLDGGHIAIAWYERIRSRLYARLRKPDPGRVDHLTLMPLTYAATVVFGAFTLLTVVADVINPVSIVR